MRLAPIPLVVLLVPQGAPEEPIAQTISKVTLPKMASALSGDCLFEPQGESKDEVQGVPDMEEPQAKLIFGLTAEL
jgi:hypothetical protein